MIFAEKRGTFPMAAKRKHALMSLGLAGVIALAAFSTSESVVAKPKADQTFAQAQSELKKGHVDKAISLAEAAVQAAPREPSYRALLGQAYLRAGRFGSAIAALNDAMTLGDNSARTALALSLANTAAGNNAEAVAILNDWRDAIPASDLGLALALAGDSGRGVQLLTDTLRAGNATPQLRQNLAYAFALDGRWREARMMISQDVPAGEIDARISAWAARSRPEDAQQRIAALLGTPVRSDPGMPVQLALSAGSETQQLAAEAAAVAPQAIAPVVPSVAIATPSELPPVDGSVVAAPVVIASYAAPVAVPVTEVAVAPSEPVTPAVAPSASFDQAFASNGVTFVSNPVIQSIPARAEPVRVAVRAAPRVAAQPHRPVSVAVRPVSRGGSHLVQLGSFSSQQGARRAWGIFAARNPSLRGFKMTITQATVHGKQFWRVAAAGFDGTGARGMCSAVKQRGGVCFAYAAPRAGAPALAVAKPAARGPALATRR
jgi:Flp pilus assembly protein TadD